LKNKKELSFKAPKAKKKWTVKRLGPRVKRPRSNEKKAKAQP
jgi:hypothetical protein